MYFHIIYADKTVEGGHISKETYLEQRDVLNADFKGTGIEFSIGDQQYIKNATWYNHATLNSSIQDEMKRALHRGQKGDLNVYLFVSGSHQL